MILHTPPNAGAELLADLRDILTLLAMTSAVIASPKTPHTVARITAVVAQHTAMAWAELLEGVIAEQGGEL